MSRNKTGQSTSESTSITNIQFRHLSDGRAGGEPEGTLHSQPVSQVHLGGASDANSVIKNWEDLPFK